MCLHFRSYLVMKTEKMLLWKTFMWYQGTIRNNKPICTRLHVIVFSEDLVYLPFTCKGAQSDLGGISGPTLQEYVWFLTAAYLCSFSDHMFGLFWRAKTVTLHMITRVISRQQWQNWHRHSVKSLLRELVIKKRKIFFPVLERLPDSWIFFPLF